MEDWFPSEADLEDRLYPSLTYEPPDEWDVEVDETDTIEENDDEGVDAVPQ